MKKAALISLMLFLFIGSCQAQDAMPLSFYCTGGMGNGESISNFSEKDWKYDYSYLVMGANGDTIMGGLDSQMQIEGRDGVSQMGYMKVGLSSRTYSLNLGDNSTNFSELTLNSMSYQGAGITLKPTTNFIVTMVGGSRGNGYWGRTVRRDTRPEETFSGLRTTYYPSMNFGINATYLTMANSGKDVFSYGGQYMMGPMNFYAEYGSAGDGKGFIGQAKYGARGFSVAATYRDIDADYQNPVDYISFVGKRGAYSTLSYSPFSSLTISGRYDSYIDSFALDPRRINSDTSADIYYDLTPSTQIYASSWQNDRQAYDRGGLSEGNYVSLVQNMYFLTNYSIYFKAQPSKFMSFSASEESYTENRNIFGLNLSLFDMASLNVESENADRDITTLGLNVQPSAIEVRLDLPETRLAWGDFYLSSSVDYRKDVADAGTTEATTTINYDITLSYRPSKDLSCYVSGIVSNVDGPDAQRITANQTNIKFGLTYAFASNFYLKADSSVIEGYVFNDINGNGIKEQSESGVSGVMVFLGNKVAVTDIKGHYRISGYKGSTAEIDMKTLPDGYICTTPSSSLDIQNGRVDFGLIRDNIADQPAFYPPVKISSIK